MNEFRVWAQLLGQSPAKEGEPKCCYYYFINQRLEVVSAASPVSPATFIRRPLIKKVIWSFYLRKKRMATNFPRLAIADWPWSRMDVSWQRGCAFLLCSGYYYSMDCATQWNWMPSMNVARVIMGENRKCCEPLPRNTPSLAHFLMALLTKRP